ncbi:RDD family protein [Tenacibaculum sp. 190524A05c]|uniref:RDD family protein n=1 Tax=Tenacibaculum platacis TaxID=3137852 RepID=UPI0032B2A502
MKDVTKGTRIVNFTIDYFIILVIYIIVVTITYNNSELLFILIYFLYYLILESVTQGQTIGKIVTKTKVVNYLNEKPSFKKIFWRTLLRLNPFDTASYLFGQEGHDSISKTKLVSSEV